MRYNKNTRISVVNFGYHNIMIGGIFMQLKGSRTEANLMAAYAGESQATNKYRYYASKANMDG